MENRHDIALGRIAHAGEPRSSLEDPTDAADDRVPRPRGWQMLDVIPQESMHRRTCSQAWRGNPRNRPRRRWRPGQPGRGIRPGDERGR